MNVDGLKLAFYIPLLSYGGSERVVIDLINEFESRSEVQVYLITDLANSLLIGQIRPGVNLIDLPHRRSLAKVLKVLTLRTIFKKNNFDYVLSNLTHANIHSLLALLFYKKHTRPKLGIVEHNVIRKVIASRISIVTRLWLNVFGQLLYPAADDIICVSNSVRDDVQCFLASSDKKLETIYNPIDTDRIIRLSRVPIENDILSLLAGKHVIINVSRFDEQKNHKLLVEAFEYLDSQNYFLLLIGDGPTRKKTEEYVNLRNISNVLFIGTTENPYKYMSVSEIYVSTSKFEGFGLVLAESKLLSSNLVAVECTAVCEIIDLLGGGYIVSSDAVSVKNAIVAASKEVIDGRERVISNFSVKKIANKYYSLIRASLSQSL